MNDAYNIYPDKGKSSLSFLVFGVMVACCIYHLSYGEPTKFVSKWQYVFKDSHQAVTICAIVLTPFLIFALKNIFSSEPAITIDAEGIYDRRHSKYVIPWNSVLRSGRDSTQIGRQTFSILSLELTDSGREDVKLTSLYHLNANYYKSNNPNIIYFYLHGLDYDYDALDAALHSYKYARQPVNSRQSKPISRKLFN